MEKFYSTKEQNCTSTKLNVDAQCEKAVALDEHGTAEQNSQACAYTLEN